MVVAIESAIRTEWKFDGNKKDECKQTSPWSATLALTIQGTSGATL